jgi:hypothetical protein
MGAMVIGTQNRIEFDRQTPIAAQPDGRPDCRVDEAIDKDATVFRFLPLECEPQVDCDAVRAVVLALDNVDPIPDASVLYRCRIVIAADAAVGPHALRNREARASADLGQVVPTTGTDGVIEVSAAPAASIDIGSAAAPAGASTTFAVTLALLGDPPAAVATVQNDIGFAALTPIASDLEGRPACTVDPQIDKDDTSFVFLPPDCSPGVDCSGIRAMVAGDVSPIPDGAVLYACAVEVRAEAAAGLYPLAAAMPLIGGPQGEPLAAMASDGAIEVTEPPLPCVGDCDGSRTVTIEELLLGVNIAIGSASLPACGVFDGDLDGRVAVSELVRAVTHALGACP